MVLLCCFFVLSIFVGCFVLGNSSDTHNESIDYTPHNSTHMHTTHISRLLSRSVLLIFSFRVRFLKSTKQNVCVCRFQKCIVCEKGCFLDVGVCTILTTYKCGTGFLLTYIDKLWIVFSVFRVSCVVCGMEIVFSFWFAQYK